MGSTHWLSGEVGSLGWGLDPEVLAYWTGMPLALTSLITGGNYIITYLTV